MVTFLQSSKENTLTVSFLRSEIVLVSSIMDLLTITDRESALSVLRKMMNSSHKALRSFSTSFQNKLSRMARWLVYEERLLRNLKVKP